MLSGAVVTGGGWEGWSEGGEGELVELEGLGEGSSTFTCAMLPGEREREREREAVICQASLSVLLYSLKLFCRSGCCCCCCCCCTSGAVATGPLPLPPPARGESGHISVLPLLVSREVPTLVQHT